jgi:predicted  nucleic acid-binding Zn-ribbon protein
MSYVTSKDGIKARKAHRCDLCGEAINSGDIQDVRSGLSDDGWYTMHMHPECHKYEQKQPSPVDSDWYEDISEPAFDRKKATDFALSAHPAKTKETSA